MVLFTPPFDRALLEELKGEDIFLFADLEDTGIRDESLLEGVDALSVKSQYQLGRLSERLRNKSHLIEDGIAGGELLRKARDNFYPSHEFPWVSGKNLTYYGPLKKESFDRSLFEEVVRMKRDWNFTLVGTPREVDNNLVNTLVGLGNVYFLGEKPEDGNGDFYQNLSSVSVLWAPVRQFANCEKYL